MGRNVHGPHRFPVTSECQFTNGLLRVTVGAVELDPYLDLYEDLYEGGFPRIGVEAYRGAVTVGDTYHDTYHDTYGGSTSTPEWLDVGDVAVDSPGGVLTAVRLESVSAHAIVVRLVVPATADAYLTLRRGERHVHVQHGSTRAPLVRTERRVRFATPPTGIARAGRVDEVAPAIDGFPRFVASLDRAALVDAPGFGVSVANVTSARFGFGVGTYARSDRPVDLHRQLGDASRTSLVVVEEEEAA